MYSIVMVEESVLFKSEVIKLEMRIALDECPLGNENLSAPLFVPIAMSSEQLYLGLERLKRILTEPTKIKSMTKPQIKQHPP